MWPFSIIEEEPVSQVAIEFTQVTEQQVLVVVHEVFLERPVKAFDVGIHFRGAGIGPPVSHPALFQAVLEVAQEFGAVVREDEAQRSGQEDTQGVEGAGRLATGRGGAGQGDGEAGLGVDEGEEVEPEAIPQADHGITGEDIEGQSGVALGGRALRRRGTG